MKAIAKVLKVSISDLTDDQIDINLIRNEIFNTNVLNKSKHRSLSAHIMNIILTIALVISMATVLIPVINIKISNNRIKDFSLEDIYKIEMVLTNGYFTNCETFEHTENSIFFYILNFDILKTNIFSDPYHSKKPKFYLCISLYSGNDFIIKDYEDIKVLSNNNIIYYDLNIDYFVLNTQVPIDIQLYYENKIWYIDIQESQL